MENYLLAFVYESWMKDVKEKLFDSTDLRQRFI